MGRALAEFWKLCYKVGPWFFAALGSLGISMALFTAARQTDSEDLALAGKILVWTGLLLLAVSVIDLLLQVILGKTLRDLFRGDR